MKVLFDLMGAPSSSGGMRLYAREVVASWAESHPTDLLTVLAGRWAAEQFADYPSVKIVTWSNESIPMRALGQFLVATFCFYVSRSDVLLSISPIVTPLVARGRRICVVHDWRHLKNAEEFGFFQKQYRRLWVTSVNRAGAAISISEKTMKETAKFASESRGRLVENGRDNARRWKDIGARPNWTGGQYLVTFGHQSNKRPELVIRAFAAMTTELDAGFHLTVLGASGEYAGKLSMLARQLGLGSSCDFPGFVEELEYQAIVRNSSVVVLASSDEGFGLPVAEAQYFGIPVVVATDSGLAEIHAGLIVAEPTIDKMAHALGIALSSGLEEPQSFPLLTWERAVDNLRATALELVSR